ncbi:hypothetical protein PsYK624_058250 [Phanerochaete sordida]|uniref:Uncharacterized protein n=1 Tax=Phanerochaete sordida TaxID=48140 RepID=A0A9P3G985_9APHY|nr:hypothetical protein PsYK624_058250 [Phanerochaete sordida]
MRMLVVLVAWFGASILCLLLLIYCQIHPLEGCADRSPKTPARRLSRYAASLTTLRTERFDTTRGALYLDCSVQAGTSRTPGFFSRFLTPLGTPSPAPRNSPTVSLGSGDNLTAEAPFTTSSAAGLDSSVEVECSTPLPSSHRSVEDLLGSPTGAGQCLPAPSTPVPTLLIEPPAEDDGLQSQATISPSDIPSPTRGLGVMSSQERASRLLKKLSRDTHAPKVPMSRFLKVQPPPIRPQGRGRMTRFIRATDPPATAKTAKKGRGKARAASTRDT